MPRPTALLPLLLALAGCAGAQADSPAAQYPALVPLETLVLEVPPAAAPSATLEARASALRARAAALRRITP